MAQPKNAHHSETVPEERLVQKYIFIKDKIAVNYQKGVKILRISKICAAVLFLFFTLIAVICGAREGTQLGWLSAWIILIFVNIFVFVPAEYAKYLIEAKVIPYLEDDTQIEFGEYDIFREDEEDDDVEEEDEA